MKLIEHTPEAIAHARHLYENTAMPVADIAKILEIGQCTLYKRKAEWGWRPRNLKLAELDDAAKANVPLKELSEIAEPAKKIVEKISLLDRVRSAVENEIIKIDDVLQRVESVHLRSTDAERAARTLAMLVRTLRELTALEKPADAKVGEEDKREASDEFRDLDEFRSSLAERLDRLRASGEA